MRSGRRNRAIRLRPDGRPAKPEVSVGGEGRLAALSPLEYDPSPIPWRKDARTAPSMTDKDLRSQVTRSLREAGAGADAEATERLAEALYPELRRIAGSLMRRERVGHTLQPTALVGEAFVRLVDERQIDWQGRAHFLGIAARVMRRILVEHARRRAAEKRGGGVDRVTFDERLGHGKADDVATLDVHLALEKLEALDPRGARVAELRLFGGLTVAEIAHVVGTSARTVDSDWAVARRWLARELGG
jgi:RNA polymerase sigma-70 factor (ECF subfamily)